MRRLQASFASSSQEATGGTAENYARLVREDSDKYARLVKELNIKAE